MSTIASHPHPSDDSRSWRHPAPQRRASPPPKRTPSVGPVTWWALVMVLATFSFYVYVLQEQVLRGEQAREAQAQAPRSNFGAAVGTAGTAQEADPGGDVFDLMQMPPALQLRVGASR